MGVISHIPYDSIYLVVKNAFETAEQSDGNEHNLVNSLRQSNAFISSAYLTIPDIRGAFS